MPPIPDSGVEVGAGVSGCDAKGVGVGEGVGDDVGIGVDDGVAEGLGDPSVANGDWLAPASAVCRTPALLRAIAKAAPPSTAPTAATPATIDRVGDRRTQSMKMKMRSIGGLDSFMRGSPSIRRVHVETPITRELLRRAPHPAISAGLTSLMSRSCDSAS